MHNIFTKKTILVLSLLIGLGFQSSTFADYTCKNVRFEIPVTDMDGTTRTIKKHVPTFQHSGLSGQVTRWRACIAEGKTRVIAKPGPLGMKTWMNSVGLTSTEKIKFCETHPKVTASADSGAGKEPDFRTLFMFPAFTTKVSNDKKWRDNRVGVWVSQSQCTQILDDHQASLDAAQAAIDAAAAAAEEAANRCNFCLYNQKQVYKGCLAKGSKIEKNTDIPTCKLRTAKEVMDELGQDSASSVVSGSSGPITETPVKKKLKRSR